MKLSILSLCLVNYINLYYKNLILLRLFVTLLFTMISLITAAQQFGGNPTSMKWKQINSDTARVIFPYGIEESAREVAETIHQLARQSHYSIGPRIRKINVVLQNQTILSNGYVALGPYRSEFYLTPRQNNFELGSLPWHQSLALHEYRHVQQYNNFKTGISKAAHYLFGEQGQALANALVIPDWFFEGDAVYQETYFSNQGRGRIPYFHNSPRSVWASDKKYSWLKWRNGSLRDMLPNHYQLGYMITHYGYQQYGDSIWQKITQDAATYKNIFYPFQKAVYRYTGESFSTVKDKALISFSAQIQKLSDSASRYGNAHKHFNADHEFPQWVNDSTIIYLKSSYKKIPAFYTRNIYSGKENKLANKSISTDNYFSFRNGKIVYSSYSPDPRWGWKNYGEIKILDVHTGKEYKATSKTKYLSPDINNDGQLIVAVHADPSGRHNLHLLNTTHENEIKEIPNPSDFIITQPKFYCNDSIIATVRNNLGEIALAIFDFNGKYELLTPFSFNIIGYPQVNGDTINFTMSTNGQDRMFSIVKRESYIFYPEFPNYHTGDYHHSTYNNKHAWMTYTAVGWHVINGGGRFEKITLNKDSLINPDNLITNSVSGNYAISKYRKSYKLFNFHSWRPYINDPEYSFSILGENVLNTFQSDIYINYNRNEQFKELGASLAYADLFPIIRGGGSIIIDRNYSDSIGTTTWNESSVYAGINIPLSFTKGTFYKYLNPSVSIHNKSIYYTGLSKDSNENKQFTFADLSLSFTNQQLKARQQIYPRFAQSISVRYRTIISKYQGNQLNINGVLYFPGLYTNHSLVLQAAYQSRDSLRQYAFSNILPLSRGYRSVNFPHMWRIGFNYHFPIIYPDAGFANIFYLLRVRGNLFYDYSELKRHGSGDNYPLRSTGIELFFDAKWWNQLPLSFGIRYSKLTDAGLVGMKNHQWEFILPLTILNR